MAYTQCHVLDVYTLTGRSQLLVDMYMDRSYCQLMTKAWRRRL